MAGGVRRDPALRELERALLGPLVRPGDPAYAEARLPYNTRYAPTPRAIAYAAGAGDVARAVRWSRRHGVHPAARCGGHSYAAYSSRAPLVVDLRRLRSVRVDAARRRVTVGGGARLIDVYAALERHDLVLPAGSCPTVGISGLTLGGGVGFSSRKWGLTADNLLAAQIVTADGRIRICDRDTEPDLFWALRGGGGGNFGIVTRLTFRVHRTGRVATFQITWPWSDAARAVAAWQAWAPRAPDGLFSVLQLAAPGAGTRLAVGSSGQFHGSEAELRRLLEPLVSAGTPTRVTVRTRTHWEATLMWAGCDDLTECRRAGHSVFAAKSQYAKRPFSKAAIDRLVGWVERRQTGRHARSRQRPARLVRRRHRPRAACGDGLRAPRCTLPAAVPDVLEPSGGRAGGDGLAPGRARRHAAGHVGRVRELHRPGAPRLAARVLRREPPPAPPSEAPLRPAELLPLPPEHPARMTLRERLLEVVHDERRVVDGPSVRDAHARDVSYHAPRPPDVVVYPESTAEVAACSRGRTTSRVPVVPLGAGTSLEGHVHPGRGAASRSTSPA